MPKDCRIATDQPSDCFLPDRVEGEVAMQELNSNLSIRELQQAIAEWEVAVGFASETAIQNCLLLGEEVGELFKAVRATSDMRIDPASTLYDVGDELADVLIMTISIANRCSIDLDSAVRQKYKNNLRRRWQSK